MSVSKGKGDSISGETHSPAADLELRNLSGFMVWRQSSGLGAVVTAAAAVGGNVADAVAVVWVGSAGNEAHANSASATAVVVIR